jgi:hypothetical protein
MTDLDRLRETEQELLRCATNVVVAQRLPQLEKAIQEYVDARIRVRVVG